MADDARKPTGRPPVPLVFGLLVVASVVAVTLLIDWWNPCTGRLIDPLACLARVLGS